MVYSNYGGDVHRPALYRKPSWRDRLVAWLRWFVIVLAVMVSIGLVVLAVLLLTGKVTPAQVREAPRQLTGRLRGPSKTQGAGADWGWAIFGAVAVAIVVGAVVVAAAPGTGAQGPGIPPAAAASPLSSELPTGTGAAGPPTAPVQPPKPVASETAPTSISWSRSLTQGHGGMSKEDLLNPTDAFMRALATRTDEVAAQVEASVVLDRRFDLKFMREAKQERAATLVNGIRSNGGVEGYRGYLEGVAYGTFLSAFGRKYKMRFRDRKQRLPPSTEKFQELGRRVSFNVLLRMHGEFMYALEKIADLQEVSKGTEPPIFTFMRALKVAFKGLPKGTKYHDLRDVLESLSELRFFGAGLREDKEGHSRAQLKPSRLEPQGERAVRMALIRVFRTRNPDLVKAEEAAERRLEPPRTGPFRFQPKPQEDVVSDTIPPRYEAVADILEELFPVRGESDPDPEGQWELGVLQPREYDRILKALRQPEGGPSPGDKGEALFESARRSLEDWLGQLFDYQKPYEEALAAFEKFKSASVK